MKESIGTLWVHYLYGFFYNCRVKIDKNEGYIRHFRSCHASGGAHFPLDSLLINDTWVAEWSRRIQANVEEVRLRVLKTKSINKGVIPLFQKLTSF